MNYADIVKPEEMQTRNQWVQTNLADVKTKMPFSFVSDGKPSEELLKAWPGRIEQQTLDKERLQRTFLWTDPKTGLEVRCSAVEFLDFPVIEWAVYFKNTGKADSPILENIQALDGHLQRGTEGEFLLHHQAGSQATWEDYRPLQTSLPAKADLRLSSKGGRGSDGVWSYFNLEWSGEGVIIAIGWPGQWTAAFTRDEKDGLRIRAGQELTHFKLLPGEEVRSPLMVLLFWKGGDWLRAQNVWRRWMIAYNMPRPGKKLPPPILAGGSNGLLREMFDANEENQKQFLDGYLDHDVKLDLWWMDAGWYPCQKGWYDGVGNWEMDRQRFPNGLRAVTDYAHRRGVNALLWFEPERVAPGTWLDENKKHWLLGPDGRQKLFSLGNPEARQWMVERIEKIMKAEGIDIYRQDFNIRPLEYWKENDAPDRQGITEIKHCMGYLAFWDELRRRIPNLLIDACASGGRRLDLETLRRALPLHKSDMNYFDLTAKQTQFYGLSLWHPYFATCAMPLEKVDTYGVRTCFALLLGVDYDIRRDDVDFALLRKLTAEWREIAPNYYGDFWPLTQWSYALDTWIAWQFDRPDEGQGVIQIFRRQESPYETARFKLRGLDPAATYRLKDFDKEGTTEFRGRDLMEKGLLVTMEKAPQAAVITYEKT